MAINTRVNPWLKVNNDTGFGNNPADYGGRFVNRDGSFNLVKEGMPFWDKFSVYHTMLNLPRWKFISLIICFFLLINLVFGSIYFFIGADQMQGVLGKTPWTFFKEMYFFSTETFTTVGYGRVNPVGDGANFVAALESMTGFLSFAIATGLIYGRFAKPKAYLIFSDHALVSPYQDITALMFRFASYKDNHTLTNVEIKINLGMTVQEKGKPTFKFYDLELERSRVESLPMNWTVVHPIDEKSPLKDYALDDMKAADIEIYVLVRGFDDVYSTVVLQRTSYTHEEILFNRKFVQMYRESKDGKTTILELQKLNDHKEIKIKVPAE
ncbi:MAG: transporter [Bacteroidetes bacterium]|nr:transporter [Bacteroidota bacterium]